MSRIARSEAARLGRDTLAILAKGSYEISAGTVSIADAVARAVAGTVEYPPDHVDGRAVPPPVARAAHDTVFEVVNETTLDAARRCSARSVPVALNFASANKPGGGFVGGARAQEESLARSSALFACLEHRAMYGHHRTHRNPMYTDWVIHSPDVPVFRTDAGELLDAPYACAFITSPAVNAKVVLERDGSRGSEIEAAMRRRVDKVLAVAAAHGHTCLVLGAWGCGVFGNDPSTVAGLFRTALQGPYRDCFERVVFAVVDWTADERIVGPFRRAFTGPV